MITKFVNWLKSLFKRNHKVIKYHVPYTPTQERYIQSFKATKAYADQRQKAQHNRKRKPSKAMKHIYHLANR